MILPRVCNLMSKSRGPVTQETRYNRNGAKQFETSRASADSTKPAFVLEAEMAVDLATRSNSFLV